MVEERAQSFRTRSIKNASKLSGLRLAVSMLDLTTLEGKDTPGKVAHLCGKALQPMQPGFEAPRCAAVCVYPKHVKTACRLVEGSGVAVASVATAFPSGQYPLRLRLKDVEFAVGQGATEIDMVIDRGAFLCGEVPEGCFRDRSGEAGLR